jgi:hypothetical protein
MAEPDFIWEPPARPLAEPTFSFGGPKPTPAAPPAAHEHRDFRGGQVRRLYNLPDNEESKATAEQSEWTTLMLDTDTKRPKQYKYACAAPLTPLEMQTARSQGLGYPVDDAYYSSPVACRMLDPNKDDILPLCSVPEIELALQAMLACSLDSGRKTSRQKCVMEYWTQMLTIFPRCVHEIEVSTCPEIVEYRFKANQEKKDKECLRQTYLIPIGDVNHKASMFYAYADVWYVFAAIFGKIYECKDSFYFDNSEDREVASDEDDDEDDDDEDRKDGEVEDDDEDDDDEDRKDGEVEDDDGEDEVEEEVITDEEDKHEDDMWEYEREDKRRREYEDEEEEYKTDHEDDREDEGDGEFEEEEEDEETYEEEEEEEEKPDFAKLEAEKKKTRG